MILEFKQNYESYNDKELIEFATKPQTDKKPNEEGVAYLLYKRYDPMLHKLYLGIYERRFELYGDCLSDLFYYLKKGNPAWRKLMNLEWRCTFGTWLRVTARNRFVEIKPFLTGKILNPVSIDAYDKTYPVLLHEGSKEDYEDNERKVILMEAISLLKNEDQKFVMTKRLQGYNSKEIAELLQKRWQKHGIVRYYNNKDVVVPDAAYVDGRTQRAKDNLRMIIKKLI